MTLLSLLGDKARIVHRTIVETSRTTQTRAAIWYVIGALANHRQPDKLTANDQPHGTAEPRRGILEPVFQGVGVRRQFVKERFLSVAALCAGACPGDGSAGRVRRIKRKAVRPDQHQPLDLSVCRQPLLFIRPCHAGCFYAAGAILI